jgi:hypothetical protein
MVSVPCISHDSTKPEDLHDRLHTSSGSLCSGGTDSILHLSSFMNCSYTLSESEAES